MLKFLSSLVILLPCLLHASAWAPDYLIVGAQKAGTTVLYQLMNQHPQMVKKDKEVHFFDINFAKGVGWYKDQFSLRPDSTYLIGDKSPYYLFHPYVPQRVHSLYPHVKIIVLLRNPIDRAYSQYWMNKRAKREPLSFEEAIAAEPSRLEGQNHKLEDITYKGGAHRKFSYLARGIYVEQIKNWLKYFPKKQILIVSSTDLRKYPQQTLNTCFAFLDLPSSPIIVKNPEKHSDYPPMDPEFRKQLAKYFLPYTQELEELFQLKFNWY